MTSFNTAVRSTPYTITIEKDGVTAKRSDGTSWKFSKDLKPVSAELGNGMTVYYSVDTASASSSGLGAITATDINGVSIPRPVNGVGALPEVMEAISQAAANPAFPQDIVNNLPGGFKNVGQPEPGRKR